MSAFNDDPVERDYSFLKEWDEPDVPPTRSWIKRGHRKVDGQMRTVWRAQAKIGTSPGTIALFLSEPVEGQACEVVEDLGNDIRWERPRRVTIDRIDDVAQRVRCSLR